MRFLVRLLLLIICFNASITYATGNKLNTNPKNYRLSYGTSPYEFGELRVPEGPGPFPVAIIIHGGCWVSKFADLENTSQLAESLRHLGIATWNIEYRQEDISGGGWPGTFLDVAHAADYLRTVADQYSLNLKHVIVIGHSAGGHLGLWLAARHRLAVKSPVYTPDPLKLKGVIVLGGVPDLQSFRQQGISQCGGDVVGKLIANSPRNYHDASPQQLVPLSVPQIFIYGTNDDVVPEQFGLAYQKIATGKGDDVSIIEVPDAAHHAYVIPNSVTWPALKASVMKLLHMKNRVEHTAEKHHK